MIPMTEYSVGKFYSEYALKKEDSIIAVIDSGTNARKVCDRLNEQDKLIRKLRAEVEVHKHPLFSTRQAEEKIERYESDLRMCREKALYWRNKAEDIFGDMRTNVELKRENEQLKSTNMEMEDYIGRLEEEKIKLQIKLQKIRDYAKEDGEVKQGIIEKVILE